MDDEMKARFRQFAMSWNDEDLVFEDSGLTGRDLKVISAKIDGLVAIREMSLEQMAREFGGGTNA